MPKASYPRFENAPIASLKPNPWNTNHVSPANETKLEASLARRGLFKPLVVREANGFLEILGGQHRWEAANRVGITTVPVFNHGPIDDQEAKEIMVLDNARSGADDTLAFADLLGTMGSIEELALILPYGAEDLEALFSASNIALDELELDEKFDRKEEPEEPVVVAPKTHTVMRFKVPNADAERITDVITRTQSQFGLNESDVLTNAGDALVHLFFTGGLEKVEGE